VLLLLLVKTSHGQETTTCSLGIFKGDNREQCPVLGCCEYECCGKGTSWNKPIGYCVEDPDSPRLDSSFPPVIVRRWMHDASIESAVTKTAAKMVLYLTLPLRSVFQIHA
jgi:hypothetical protein